MDRKTRQFIERRLLTSKELAALLHVSEATLQKRVERGKIEGVKKGRTYLFDRRDFLP